MIHLYLTLYFITDALFNSYVIKWGSEIAKLKGKKISYYNTLWHRAQAAKVAMMSLAPVIIFYTHTSPFHFLIGVFAIRFVVFDAALNLFLGISPFYVGTTGEIDKLFRKLPHPEVFMVISKIAVLVIYFIIANFVT